MDFAQALARIEEALKDGGQYSIGTAQLLCHHADSIVQLGKVAQEMRELIRNIKGLRGATKSCESYDKLMNRGDDECLGIG